MEQSMQPIGFVICQKGVENLFIYGKIYPYYAINGPDFAGDFSVKIIDDCENEQRYWHMFLELKPTNDHRFEFFFPPEFPQDISEWAEDDWFNFSLKYG